jgi:hypothetical protein
MSFRVKWRRKAKQALAAVWLTAPDRNEVTAAAHRIEVILRRDPLGIGESRGGDFRIVFDQPISLLYQVDPVRREVRIITVGPAGPP